MQIPKIFEMRIQLKKKDYDAEKTSGIKLHIGVDVLSLPHAVLLTTAEVTDRAGAIEMVEHYAM